MKLLTFEYQNRKQAGVLTAKGVAPIEGVADLLEIIRAGSDSAALLHDLAARMRCGPCCRTKCRRRSGASA